VSDAIRIADALERIAAALEALGEKPAAKPAPKREPRKVSDAELLARVRRAHTKIGLTRRSG
jgi:hypothetical protein